MVLYPGAQVRAQAELDAVVGRSRVPTFADYEHLPYIRAMAKEVRCFSSPLELYKLRIPLILRRLYGVQALRWGPAAPLGLPMLPQQTITTKATSFPQIP